MHPTPPPTPSLHLPTSGFVWLPRRFLHAVDLIAAVAGFVPQRMAMPAAGDVALLLNYAACTMNEQVSDFRYHDAFAAHQSGVFDPAFVLALAERAGLVEAFSVGAERWYRLPPGSHGWHRVAGLTGHLRRLSAPTV